MIRIEEEVLPIGRKRSAHIAPFGADGSEMDRFTPGAIRLAKADIKIVIGFTADCPRSPGIKNQKALIRGNAGVSCQSPVVSEQSVSY